MAWPCIAAPETGSVTCVDDVTPHGGGGEHLEVYRNLPAVTASKRQAIK